MQLVRKAGGISAGASDLALGLQCLFASARQSHNLSDGIARVQLIDQLAQVNRAGYIGRALGAIPASIVAILPQATDVPARRCSGVTGTFSANVLSHTA